MLPDNCPDRSVLSNFVLGKLAGDDSEAVAGHVEDCSDCQAEIGTVEMESDTLVSAIRGRGNRVADQSGEFEDESALQRMLGRIKQIGCEPPSAVATPLSDGVPDNLGTIRDYRLLARLGEGGMGAVYKALHMRLDKVVALKVLRAERMQPIAVARFQREMRAVGKLQHPNIVQAFDAGEHEGTHFLVMECVEGLDLSALVRQHGPLPVADACEIIRQAAIGLQYAHEHGLVHRDIKPANLMLSTPATVKILDLGLALLHEPHVAGEELTAASQMMGTADYIAPEQTGDSHGVDIRADIYSLGCTLYKLLTGEAPYAGEDYKQPLQKMMAHLGTPFPDIRENRPEVPAALATVLGRMVAKKPEDRFATPA